MTFNPVCDDDWIFEPQECAECQNHGSVEQGFIHNEDLELYFCDAKCEAEYIHNRPAEPDEEETDTYAIFRSRSKSHFFHLGGLK